MKQACKLHSSTVLCRFDRPLLAYRITVVPIRGLCEFHVQARMVEDVAIKDGEAR